jgi:hypothetical protein
MNYKKMTIKKITLKGKQSNKININININRDAQKECLLILEKKT